MYLTLETPRLLLRPFDLGDIPAITAITGRPNVRHYMQDMIYDTRGKAEAWVRMLHAICEPVSPTVLLAIVPKDLSVPVGYIGLHPKEELDSEVEILYAVMDEKQNNGYAAEAGKALIGWCFVNTSVPFLAAIVKPGNIPSSRVAQKLGFLPQGEKTLPYNGTPTLFTYYRLYKRQPHA